MTENKCQDLGDLEEIVSLNPDDEILCNRNSIGSDGNYVGGAVSITILDFKKNLDNISQSPAIKTKKKALNFSRYNKQKENNKITDADGEDITLEDFIEDFANISEASLRMMCVASSTEDSNIHFLTLNWEQIKVIFQQIIVGVIAPLSTQLDNAIMQIQELSANLDNAESAIDDLQNQINDLKNRVDIIEPQTQQNSLLINILDSEISKIVVSMSYSDILTGKNK